MVDAGNGGVSDNKTLHYTGSNPVLTTKSLGNSSATSLAEVIRNCLIWQEEIVKE